MLREIVAIVRCNRWRASAEALQDTGFAALTRQRVFGRGRQRGLRHPGGRPGDVRVSTLPKWMLTLVVEDERVDAAVAALLKANRSGDIGDGKIFVLKVSGVRRVSDGAHDRRALEDATLLPPAGAIAAVAP